MAVCVATYRQPEGLRELLQKLALQEFARDDHPRIDVIVVDNDAAGSAAGVCREFLGRRWNWHYLIEPRRGIPQARNRAVASARALGCGFIAFIDDDERPSACWLHHLLRAQTSFQADIVQGRAAPLFQPRPEKWIVDGGIFEHMHRSTGDRLDIAATNNVLVKSDVFARLGGFEESWALCGGTDSLFFSKAARAGFRIVYCSEALCHELIGPDRANGAWICRRALRVGITLSQVNLALDPGWKTRFGSARLGLRLMLEASARLLLPPSWGDCDLLRLRARKLCTGAGIFAGNLGFKYQEYR